MERQQTAHCRRRRKSEERERIFPIYTVACQSDSSSLPSFPRSKTQRKTRGGRSIVIDPPSSLCLSREFTNLPYEEKLGEFCQITQELVCTNYEHLAQQRWRIFSPLLPLLLIVRCTFVAFTKRRRKRRRRKRGMMMHSHRTIPDKYRQTSISHAKKSILANESLFSKIFFLRNLHVSIYMVQQRER